MKVFKYLKVISRKVLDFYRINVPKLTINLGLLVEKNKTYEYAKYLSKLLILLFNLQEIRI